MNTQQLRELLLTDPAYQSYEGSSEPDWDEIAWGFRKPTIINGYEIEMVENVGGEGQGETRFVVLKVNPLDRTEPEQFFRKDGYYSSYGGSDWDGDLRKVTPVTRTVVYYE